MGILYHRKQNRMELQAKTTYSKTHMFLHIIYQHEHQILSFTYSFLNQITRLQLTKMKDCGLIYMFIYLLMKGITGTCILLTISTSWNTACT